jgi:HTH-type transcriptional regulator/antitoxin HipB
MMANSIVEIAGLVRARRKSLNLTQAELADLAGVSPRYVYDLENEKATVALDRFLSVLDALGLRLLLSRGDKI